MTCECILPLYDEYDGDDGDGDDDDDVIDVGASVGVGDVVLVLVLVLLLCCGFSEVSKNKTLVRVESDDHQYGAGASLIFIDMVRYTHNE